MFRFIGILLVLFVIFSIQRCAIIDDYETEKLDIYYNTGTVVSTGQCNKYECSYSVKTSDGTILHNAGDDPVSIGQIVYQKCWTERKKGGQCYVNYVPSKK